MNGYSYYVALGLQDYLFGNAGAITPPATTYVALSSSDCDPSGSGFLEPTAASYSRVATTTADWSNAAVLTARVANLNNIEFNTATEDWGWVRAFGVWDAPTFGNLLWGASLVADKEINIATTAVFLVSDLSIDCINTPTP